MGHLDVASNDGAVEVDRSSLAGISIEVRKGLVICQGGNGDSVVDNHAVDVHRGDIEKGRARLHCATCPNRGAAIKSEDAPVGVVRLEGRSTSCTGLVVGKNHRDCACLASLEGCGRDGDCQQRDNSGDGELHGESIS